ncbi:MAG: hypothetical protein D6719_11130 [Candidatus Dadabacteria bacterium]|nr:MAG: hypothetical protein D6719_11130 [Candidatus Dadabacteria bacterium]
MTNSEYRGNLALDLQQQQFAAKTTYKVPGQKAPSNDDQLQTISELAEKLTPERLITRILHYGDLDEKLKSLHRIAALIKPVKWQEAIQQNEIKRIAENLISRLLSISQIQGTPFIDIKNLTLMEYAVNSRWGARARQSLCAAIELSCILQVKKTDKIRRAFADNMTYILLAGGIRMLKSLSEKSGYTPESELLSAAAAGRLMYQLSIVGERDLAQSEIYEINSLLKLLKKTNCCIDLPELKQAAKEALLYIAAKPLSLCRDGEYRKKLLDILLTTIFKNSKHEAYVFMLERSLDNVNLTATERAAVLKELDLPDTALKNELIQKKACSLVKLELTPLHGLPNLDEARILVESYRIQTYALRRTVLSSVWTNINTFKWVNALRILVAMQPMLSSSKKNA